MGRLFGTDGVRGIANKDLTNELALSIGKAAAKVLAGELGRKPTVLIGKDTRASGDMLEAALTAGLCAVGANVLSVGVVPTPAVAYLIGRYGCDAGVMISASHNPCEYNGIKIFQSTGYKLDDAIEEEIEAIILDGAEEIPEKLGGDVGNRLYCKTAVEDYVRHVVETTDVRFDGLNIALDCANGSASVCAKQIFTALGARCYMLSDTPDGVNINMDCGSTHIEGLQLYVREHHLDVGFAFDGDADRCLAVDERGEVLNGDKIMYICAKFLKERGQLPGNTLVTTVMSNFGLYKALDKAGIRYEKTAVGDRYVYENMKENDYVLGGEQSGHIIFRKYAHTGDGLITALMLMEVMMETQLPLSVLASSVSMYPQVLKNVRVDDKDATLSDSAVQAAVDECTAALGDSGRVLLRKSGTEPVLRVMAEAGTAEECEKWVDHIITAMEKSGHLIEVKK